MSDAQARIAELEAELAAMRREMQSFTYAVSHDLRAPLRHIVSYAHLVQDEAGPQLDLEVQGFLSTITDSAKHLGAMLDALLELSRVGSVPLQMEAVSLQALVQELVEDLGQVNASRLIQWNIAPDMPVVHSDAALLRNALAQVLGNAIKFSRVAERPVIEVLASIDVATGNVVVTVRDNGVGFNLATLDTAFPPFQRLHHKAQFEGLGMGLAQAQKGLQRLGGGLVVASTGGEGCNVSLTGLRAFAA